MLDGLASTLPPKLPLARAEREALADAGARVLYVHGGDLDPVWGLALVLAAIAFPRVLAYYAGKPAEVKAAA